MSVYMGLAKPLVFVTGNPNKLKEVKQILSQGPHPIQIEARELDSKYSSIIYSHLSLIPVVPEIQGTTEEVARAKCKRAAELLGGPCITEDTALCFKAMNGLPGPYIKHFLTALGHEGLNNMLAGFPTKEAWALCTFAYSSGPGAEPITFEGRTDGNIVPRRGPGHFGWDAVFEPLGTAQTYAEMATELKNSLSHRYKALEKLRSYLQLQET